MGRVTRPFYISLVITRLQVEFLSPVHDILLWILCINCNFNFKESYNHSKLLIIFKGDNLRSLLTPGHFLRNINFLHFL